MPRGGGAVEKADDADDADATSGNPEDRARGGLQRLRELAPRTSWSAEADAMQLEVLAPGCGRDRGGELELLLGELGGAGGGSAPLEDLCVTLRGGGYEVAEAVCDGGAVELALDMLTAHSSSASSAAAACPRRLAAEALWLMIYDHDSSQRLIKAGGHQRVLHLLRQEGPSGDQALSRGALRVIGETLYSESRGAQLWNTGELEFIVEALDWALRVEPAAERGPLLAAVCNIAALWVWRARGAAVDALLPLVGLIPRLLEELAECNDEPDVLQQGCRLLHGLAGRCRYWPENVREPTIAAMKAMSGNYQFVPLPGSNAYCVQALKAAEAIPTQPPAGVSEGGGLSTMD